MKWVLNLRYFCTILTFSGYPVFVRVPTLSCRLLRNSEFILILAYLADIFDALNHLNRQMQAVESTSSKQKKTRRRLQKNYLYETTNKE